MVDSKGKLMIDAIAADAGIPMESAEKMLNAFISALKSNAESLDSVAIPGFGTFASTKFDEQIVNDPASGRSTLLPPAIELMFKSSVVLRKKILG